MTLRSLVLGALALCAAAAAWAQPKTEVLWLGQAATRITTPGGKVIMIDPWLGTNPKTPAEFGAALGTAAGTARMLVPEPGQKLDF